MPSANIDEVRTKLTKGIIEYNEKVNGGSLPNGTADSYSRSSTGVSGKHDGDSAGSPDSGNDGIIKIIGSIVQDAGSFAMPLQTMLAFAVTDKGIATRAGK